MGFTASSMVQVRSEELCSLWETQTLQKMKAKHKEQAETHQREAQEEKAGL